MRLITAIVLALCTHPVAAADWYAGAGVGRFDVDLETTHFGSSTATIFMGYELYKYLALEVQVEYINTGSETDEDGFRSDFGGTGLSPALIAKYPLDTPEGMIELYLRGGATYLDYTMSNVDLAESLDDTVFQPMFGVGIRTEFLFLEYVNYGKLNGMYLEQIRIGFRSKLRRRK